MIIKKNLIINCPDYKYSKDFLKNVISATSDLSKSDKFALKASGKKYIVAPKCSYLYPEFAKEQPRGWDLGQTYDDVWALHTDDGICFFDVPNTQSVKYTKAHETGHALDDAFYCITEDKSFSETEGFKKAYRKDLKELYEICDECKVTPAEMGIDYFVQGSTPKRTTSGGRRETFAEVCANLHGNGCESISEIIPTVFKNTSEYVRKLLNLLGDKI